VSLRNKLHNLETYICTLPTKPDIILLTEVRIIKEEHVHFNIPNYESIFSSRICNKKKKSGGGIGIFILNKHRFNLISEISNDLDNYILINLPEYNMNLGLLYSPPDADKTIMINNLETFFTNKSTLIFGDFNINLLDNSNNTRDYMDCILANDFFVVNNVDESFPTRVSSNGNGTIIDHIISNIKNLKCKVNYIDSDLSDHKALLIDQSFHKITTPRNCERSTFRVTNFQQLKQQLLNNPFKIDDDLDANTLAEDFVCHLNSSIDMCSRSNIINNSKQYKNPWITKELLQLCKTKSHLFKLKKLHPNDHDIISKYKVASNKVTALTKKLKTSYYNSIPTNNAKKFWNSINCIVYNKPKCSSSIPIKLYDVDNAKLISDPQLVAGIFNKYFCNIGNKLASNIPNTICQFETIYENQMSSCYFYKTDANEIMKIIDELKSDSVPGHDAIPCKFFKYCKSIISKEISIIINKCLKDGTYPEILKIGKVTPIFKSGNKSDPANYRPITVLPILSKIFEKVILTRLSSFLNSINFISPFQYGFCPASSTEAACISLLNDIQKGLDRKKNIQVGLLFIDLSKAFDTVPHDLLLNKLSKLGLKHTELSLFESYLSHRRQFVKCNNCTSTKQFILCGVPQGAILSPTLFNIFINDIAKLPLKGKITIYADDICLKYENLNPNQIARDMESDLLLLNEWFKANKLSLNVKKTKFMFIGPRHVKNDNIIPPKLNNTYIERVNEYKYLGLIIDSGLKWTAHINYIKFKIFPFIGILKRLKSVLTINIKKQIYFSFVQSHLNYLNIIWGSAAKTHIKCIKVLQNYAIKNIYNLNFWEPTTNIYKIANLPSLDTLRYINLAKFLYKLENNLIKSDLSLTLNNEIHNYATRISNIYRIDYARTNFGKYAILREAIHLYNSVPNNLKIANSLIAFKIKIKNYFLTLQNN
jgi:hypothetical protein